jgi:effector-binding domain-containing protein
MSHKVNFDAANHEYTVNGVTYMSTTQVMKKYNLSVDYGNIPANVLANAAAKGNAIHKALEEHIKGDQAMIGMFQEVQYFEDYCIQRGIDPSTRVPEEIVADNNYQIAGTIDLQYIDGQDDILADFKTTSSLHLDAVAWQLSIYNYIKCKGDLLQYYFKKLKVFHFNGSKMYVKDVYTVDYDAVVALLEAHKRRDPVFNYVKPNKVILPTEEQYLTQILNEKELHEDAIKKLDKEAAIILEKVKDQFIKHKDYSYSNGTIDLKYVAPITRRSLNQKKAKQFIKDHGGNLDDFINETISSDKATAKLSKVTKQAGDAEAMDTPK